MVLCVCVCVCVKGGLCPCGVWCLPCPHREGEGGAESLVALHQLPLPQTLPGRDSGPLWLQDVCVCVCGERESGEKPTMKIFLVRTNLHWRLSLAACS